MFKETKYKATYLNWCPIIPDNWDLIKFNHYVYLKHGFQFRDNDFTETGIKIVKITQLKSNGILDLSNCSFIDETRIDDFKNIIINNGDILMALTGGTIGKIIKANDITEIILQNYRVGNFEPISNKLLKDYLFWILSSEVILGQLFFALRETGQPNIGKEDFSKMKFPLPTLNEQKIISSFLDEKTAQIETIITKKQKLIEHLKEERIAIINQAVTKGINPNVEMKPSGIEWLGDIPKHWEVKKLKYLAKVQSSNVDKKSNENEIRVILCNYVDVYKNEFITEEIDFMKATATEEEISKFKLNIGDVLITKDSETPNDIAVPSLVRFVNDKLICGYHLAQIRSDNREICGDFLFRVFQSKDFNTNFEVAANGITRFGLSIDSIKSVYIPIPTMEEQKSIIINIEKNTTRIDKTISKIEQEIELIKEYKTSLINEVVTGKLLLN